MSGRVATITPPLQGLGVNAGDPFSIALTYDDALGVASSATVGGTVYQLMTYSFVTSMAGWTGTLPTLIASRTSSPTSSVTKQSWSRPATVLHHNEWTVSDFDLTIITDYVSNPGGEAYGWYGYGNPANIEFLLSSVVTGPASSGSVDEPGSLATVALAMVGSLVATRRGRKLRKYGLSVDRDAEHRASAPTVLAATP